MDDSGALTMIDCSGAVALKFTALLDVVVKDADRFGGLKFSPFLLGVTT